VRARGRLLAAGDALQPAVDRDDAPVGELDPHVLDGDEGSTWLALGLSPSTLAEHSRRCRSYMTRTTQAMSPPPIWSLRRSAVRSREASSALSRRAWRWPGIASARQRPNAAAMAPRCPSREVRLQRTGPQMS
jgi:hypothetical protein